MSKTKRRAAFIGAGFSNADFEAASHGVKKRKNLQLNAANTAIRLGKLLLPVEIIEDIYDDFYDSDDLHRGVRSKR